MLFTSAIHVVSQTHTVCYSSLTCRIFCIVASMECCVVSCYRMLLSAGFPLVLKSLEKCL